MSTCNSTMYPGICLAMLLLSACGGGDNGSVSPRTGVNGSYLFVTHNSQVMGGESGEKIYYANTPVASTSSQQVRIANRGADIYPLKSLSIQPALPEPDPVTQQLREKPDNSEEFFVQVLDTIVLQPAEAITVDVLFSPITQGEKSARFVVDYETIRQVEESVNINEQTFYQASELETDGQFRSASRLYTEYLANDPVTTNKRRAAIRLPIINEAQMYDGQEDLGLYLEAMRERDNNDFDLALRKLKVFTAMYADSYLADDAQYLKAYIQLIDLDKPQDALIELQSLREDFPDTNYFDTAMYIEAIAHVELGNVDVARQTLEALRQRHTSLDAFGIALPKDNLVSRMWFERANQMLESV